MKETQATVGFALRVFLIIIIILVGILGAFGFSLLKKPPKSVELHEQALQVEVVQVQPQDVQVHIKGYGQTKARDEVQIVPEVAGKVVKIHPGLEQGAIIPPGALLFKIDPRDYESAQAQARAQVTQMEATVERLEKQFAIDQQRVKTIQRSKELADSELARVKKLFEEDEVGTRSGVERAEITRNQAKDAYDQLAQQIALYPVRIEEAKGGLTAARAQLQLAQTRLERTEIRAPFKARIKMVQLELDQYIAPGSPVLVLADDSLLEITVPLDSRDVHAWLSFQSGASRDDTAWFTPPEQVPCTIAWTEDTQGAQWTGTLNRIGRFDAQTRTVDVVIQVAAQDAQNDTGLPLVDGMYCEVSIPGNSMRNVYRLPRWAVTFEGEIYLASNNRLKRKAVEVVRNQGNEIFIRADLSPDDQVIVTRLVNPLPNSLLSIIGREDPAKPNNENQ